jgi:hypothetical protein
MKKLIFVLIIILCLGALGGCQKSDADTTSLVDPPIADRLQARSIEEFYAIADAVSGAQEEKFDNSKGLFGISDELCDKGTEEIKKVLDRICSLPLPDMIDGKVSFVFYEKRRDSKDSVGSIVISIKVSEEEWMRVDYFGNSVNLEERLYEWEEYGHNILENPVTNAEGNVTVYSEMVDDHPSGTGYMQEWIVTMDGRTARINHYIATLESCISIDYFKTANISSFATKYPAP